MVRPPAGKNPAPKKATPAEKPVAVKKAAGKAAPDWERIELDYRAGIKTLRQIADENGITHGAINKRAKRDGWERDLSEKINAKADALVSKALVSNDVSKEYRIAEKQVVDANAQAVAEVRLAHRKDIHRARKLTNTLLDELEQEGMPPDERVAGDEYVDILREAIAARNGWKHIRERCSPAKRTQRHKTIAA